MAGIRLHHPTLQNCVVALEAVRPYRQPYQCPLCQVIHMNKTVHLDVDANGDVIVSRQAFQEIKDLPGFPFEVSNEVQKPPALILNLNGNRMTLPVHDIPFKGRR